MLKSLLLLTFIQLLHVNVLFSQTNNRQDFQSYANKNQFNGVVLVADDNKIVFLEAFGIANRKFKTTINTNTKFKIASITKTFTAVLILKLQEQGKLNLNDKIGKYLPDYKGAARDKVSILNLLTYSSGIPNCEGNKGIEVYQKPYSLNEFIDKFCSGEPSFIAGTQFSYNNGDYILLGKIIENITGQSFLSNINQYILLPLGMQNTSMLFHKNIIEGLADTYYLDDSLNVFYNDDPMYIENYYSAGAMYSTAEDLFKFHQGIVNYKLLSKKTVDFLFTPYPELYNVAIGFWVSDNKRGEKVYKVANRQGSIWGANANWLYLINEKKCIIVLSNTNASDLNEIAWKLVD